MRFDEYARYDALGLAELVTRGEVTPAELREAALAAIETLNPALNAVLQVLSEESAREIEGGLAAGALTGVPFLIKELARHCQVNENLTDRPPR